MPGFLSLQSPLTRSILIFLSPSLILLIALTLSERPPPAHTSITGPLTDCCCSAEVISDNNADFQSLLTPLVKNSTYFSLFHVALSKECPFWPEDGTCAIRDCSVCECPDDQVPRLWRQPTSGFDGLQQNEPRCKSNGDSNGLGDVRGVVRGDVKWQESGEEVMWTTEEKERDMVFVDLRKNIERYTGYSGEGARRVWSGIYEENCFRFAKHCGRGFCTQGACKEERVLYRLISGIHTSINMHIAKEYMFQNVAGFGTHWKPNLSLYMTRVGKHPDRIENLYFTFAVIVRALAKVSASLSPANFDYSTGNEKNDAFTRANVDKLLRHPLLAPGCTTKTFNESDMFVSSDPSSSVMLPQFKEAFRNISAIMDCIGCEKCRLWGKLQFLGAGTGLRILFDKDPGALKRNEVIALINLMYKLSTSINWIGKMEDIRMGEERKGMLVGCIVFGISFLALSSLHSNPWGRREAEHVRLRRNYVPNDTTSADENGQSRFSAHSTAIYSAYNSEDVDKES